MYIFQLPSSHNCFGPPFLLVEGLLSTGPTPSRFYLLVEMGLSIITSFSSVHVVRTRPASFFFGLADLGAGVNI